MVRAVANSLSAAPDWPDVTRTAAGQVPESTAWLRAAWADEDTAEALSLASPTLARQIEQLCQDDNPNAREVRRAVLATGRYLLRAAGRPTPFGFFAGVQTARFAPSAALSWGHGHRPVVRAAAGWLAEVIAQLEDCPMLLAQLEVVANNTVIVRGDRLVVPHQPLAHPGGATGTAEVTVRHTTAVSFAVAAAHAPIWFETLTGKLAASFPSTPPQRITRALTELVANRVLITNLHAPATEPDALGHLLSVLDMAAVESIAEVADLVAVLRSLHADLREHNRTPSRAGRVRATATTGRAVAVKRPVFAVDLLLDADLVLPEAVAREAERAAELLARVSAFPFGVAAWREYHQRFYERYGRGAMVPLLDMVADSGIGWPDGYPGTRSAERPRFGERDEALAALAQQSVLDGQREVVLDDPLLAALDFGPAEPRFPSHLEIGFHLHARDQRSLTAGKFLLEVVSVSRAAGVATGRFLPLLASEQRTQFTAALASVPAMDSGTVTAQLSYPPLDPATSHVTRTLATGQLLISLAEHREPSEQVLRPSDLAVGCDGRRMYLAAPRHGVRIEAAATYALNLRTHTPPLARLITELSRAQCAQVTRFSWGAARTLPFLPRLRHGRIVLSPATWRLSAGELPGRAQVWALWDQQFTEWIIRRRLPNRVLLTDGDQKLPLDLAQSSHRVLLRSHLDTAGLAILTEAPEPADLGWAGGRAHEIVLPLTATRAPTWPRLPKPGLPRLLGRRHGDAPGTSRVLLAALYGDLERQDTVLTRHLPELLERLCRPRWWFVRFRDPHQHLRLRIALDDPSDFGPTAAVVSTWAGELREAGLLAHLSYPSSFPEIGRWGDGSAWEAAEQVFRTDSAAALAQLSQPRRPERQALLAAQAVAIAASFTGSPTAGLDWLVRNIPPKAPAPIPRPVFSRAVHLADPACDWAALRDEVGGTEIVDGWAGRDKALVAYRRLFPSARTQGVELDDVLGSLLHCSYVRGHRIDFDDEAQVLYLARAAALARLSRNGEM
ncbi:lantibiotic dehydratase [Kitasatospora sp. MAP5-34]|uniref:lantibiotic dehydratase n=1 Tax=Kitasatospora sp. MAP5-34 TaxID=3035102 RepID=UPI002476BDDE|nr:lantibiotic dehydratase [Kitasatospora sp. MAP5-34]